jgi:hypothetical protein
VTARYAIVRLAASGADSHAPERPTGRYLRPWPYTGPGLLDVISLHDTLLDAQASMLVWSTLLDPPGRRVLPMGDSPLDREVRRRLEARGVRCPGG